MLLAPILSTENIVNSPLSPVSLDIAVTCATNEAEFVVSGNMIIFEILPLDNLVD